jgi:hypothetical protein
MPPSNDQGAAPTRYSLHRSRPRASPSRSPFEGTGDVLAYTPVGDPAAPAEQQSKWRTLPAASAFGHGRTTSSR